MERGVEAAIRRFPSKGSEIRRLALANMTFRSLCEDLADAETAVEKWGLSPAASSQARRCEYEVLGDELAAEIDSVLAALPDDER